MTSFRAIRNALGSTYLGDSKLAKALGFSAPQTFDSRLISVLQGLGQTVDAPAADAVSGLNIHDTLWNLGFTQADRNERLQAFYNELTYAKESRDKLLRTQLCVFRGAGSAGNILQGPASGVIGGTILDSTFVAPVYLTAITDSADIGFTHGSPILASPHGDMDGATPIPGGYNQLSYANSAPLSSYVLGARFNGSVGITWSRGLSSIRLRGTGTSPLSIALILPASRNNIYSSGQFPAYPTRLCLDELTVRLYADSDVNISAVRIFVRSHVGNDFLGVKLNPFVPQTSGVRSVVVRARSPVVEDRFTPPAWRVDSWIEYT